MSGPSRQERAHLERALALANSARAVTPPNPWVGCVVVASDSEAFEGATRPAGGPHAEAVALAAAGDAARGATVYVTLEPCAHEGRTPPCVDALIAAGVSRVVVGITDPDARVAGRGVARLRDAGIAVDVLGEALDAPADPARADSMVESGGSDHPEAPRGAPEHVQEEAPHGATDHPHGGSTNAAGCRGHQVAPHADADHTQAQAPEASVDPRQAGSTNDADLTADRDLAQRIADSLAPYLTQRRTGRPYVVLKLAATLDGATAAPDGTSQWITGDVARRDAHALRAESDVIVVGSGTVVTDDPSLTVRLVDAPRGDPERIVLGEIPEGAKVLPARSYRGDLVALLDELGARGVLQVLIEGGAGVAHTVHTAGLVDRYVVYLAPALMGGADAVGLFRGAGVPTMADLWRGRFVEVRQLGDDLRIDLTPH